MAIIVAPPETLRELAQRLREQRQEMWTRRFAEAHGIPYRPGDGARRTPLPLAAIARRRAQDAPPGPTPAATPRARERRTRAARPARAAPSGDEPPGPPFLISQDTASIVGLTRRRYLALLREHAIPHAVSHRLVLARVSDVLTALGLGAPLASGASDPAPAFDWRAALRASARGGR